MLADISEAVYLGDEVYILKFTPLHFVGKIKVDLLFESNRELKRTARFTKVVYEVEDKMIKVAEMS